LILHQLRHHLLADELPETPLLPRTLEQEAQKEQRHRPLLSEPTKCSLECVDANSITAAQHLECCKNTTLHIFRSRSRVDSRNAANDLSRGFVSCRGVLWTGSVDSKAYCLLKIRNAERFTLGAYKLRQYILVTRIIDVLLRPRKKPRQDGTELLDVCRAEEWDNVPHVPLSLLLESCSRAEQLLRLRQERAQF
jgi:hypothetical protein